MAVILMMSAKLATLSLLKKKITKGNKKLLRHNLRP